MMFSVRFTCAIDIACIQSGDGSLDAFSARSRDTVDIEDGEGHLHFVGYVRQNFWPLRSFADLSDVNSQSRRWLQEIANRRKHRETGQAPDDRFQYSANVVDICPVGALTERDFRFKARVWYLSCAPTVCNGCSQGCNIDLHFVLDRPHLNDGARVVRVKPRYNPDVNGWWICDEGRYGFGWVDRGRLTRVRGPSGEASWDQALTSIAAALNGARIGVIASAQLTNEELLLIQEIFQSSLSAQVTASVPQPSGYSDDFLIQADKNPNTQGATQLGLAGPKAIPAEQIISEALGGNLDVLWVMGHDVEQLFGEERACRLAVAVKL